MGTRDDIKKEIEEEDKTMGSGEGTPGSGSMDLEEDDDVGKTFAEVAGHEPHGDDNMADEINAAEEARYRDEE